ncbi:hypothetical protein FQN60_008446, partial [Etheostoma spectabile]
PEKKLGGLRTQSPRLTTARQPVGIQAQRLERDMRHAGAIPSLPLLLHLASRTGGTEHPRNVNDGPLSCRGALMKRRVQESAF